MDEKSLQSVLEELTGQLEPEQMNDLLTVIEKEVQNPKREQEIQSLQSTIEKLNAENQKLNDLLVKRSESDLLLSESERKLSESSAQLATATELRDKADKKEAQLKRDKEAFEKYKDGFSDRETEIQTAKNTLDKDKEDFKKEKKEFNKKVEKGAKKRGLDYIQAVKFSMIFIFIWNLFLTFWMGDFIKDLADIKKLGTSWIDAVAEEKWLPVVGLTILMLMLLISSIIMISYAYGYFPMAVFTVGLLLFVAFFAEWIRSNTDWNPLFVFWLLSLIVALILRYRQKQKESPYVW